VSSQDLWPPKESKPSLSASARGTDPTLGRVDELVYPADPRPRARAGPGWVRVFPGQWRESPVGEILVS
jgi:hypothetical protein